MRGRLLYSRRSSAVALMIVLVGAVTACGAPGLPSNASVPAAAQTAKVTRGTIRTTVGASGVVTALQEVLLNFTSGATVKTVNVVVGQRVNANDILGTVDTSDLMLTLQQQQANVASAQAKYDQVAAGSTPVQINVAQAAVDAAKAKYQAATTILPKDLQTAQANLDAAKAKYQATATILPKDIETARANLDAAKAKYQATATINPKDIEVARANLDQAIASYNAIILGTTTPQDITNAEAAVRSAQAKLDALNAGPLKADVISAQSKVQQAQQNLDKVKSDSANTKAQALITWQKSADATRSAQRAFDIANATYQQAKSTNVEPGVTGGGGGSSAAGGGSSASGTSTTKATAAPVATALPPTITPLKLDTLKQAADTAYLTEQQAEKTQTANQLAYENTKNAEINNNATAQQQLNDAQSAVSKLVAGPTTEDVTQAQAAVDQAKAQLDKLKRGPTDADVAKAQAAVDSARATLNDLLAGPKATDLAQAQSAVDIAQAALNDLLAGPKPTDLQQAQSAVDTAQAALNDLQAGPKATDLQQAQSAVDSAQATLNDLTAGAKTPDLETALAALDQAKAQRDLAQLNIDKATIRAPFAGLITQVNVVPGQIAASGTSATNPPAFDLVDDSQLHIDVSVSESDAATVQVGQAALISLDSVPGQTLPGSVERVSPVATTTSNVTAFPVRIAIAPTQAPVKPGANATVQIVTATHANVLTVPARAVTQVNGQPAVTVLFNGSTFLVPIRTGLSDGRNTEVLSGVNEGDTVVLPAAGTGSTGGAPGGAGGARPGG
ncbi:MAG: efflux RND transporter periplasmic adaptor subunit [Chloroflexota bacterium]|nr:efflux RND transporter periplasmic adaptor subunit [Chloroflexota bacterium]